MMRLLHLSDTHFGTERIEVARALAQLSRQLAPTHLVLSGDITQRARPAQFALARRFIDALSVPQLMVVPGNHDIALFNLVKRLFFPYRDYLRIMQQPLESTLDDDEALIIGLNTTRRYRHIQGEVSDRQIRSSCAALAAADPGQLRIVVTHQPAAVWRDEDRKDQLRGGEAALRAWAMAGADLVLGGHIHLPYLMALHEQLPGVARRCWLLQAGTAVSHRVRAEAGNSVNFIMRAGSRCEVQRWDYVDGQFALQQATSLPLQR